ncbi:hypothetical protein V6N13_089794 [Hibiscus sabdariffa]|uniref:DUF4283 domain-containing protein n=1 Tax=Hibiscus sabdariffa TaxID=183260 RepID=A0ABR2QIW2_9ROSI
MGKWVGAKLDDQLITLSLSSCLPPELHRSSHLRRCFRLQPHRFYFDPSRNLEKLRWLQIVLVPALAWFHSPSHFSRFFAASRTWGASNEQRQLLPISSHSMTHLTGSSNLLDLVDWPQQ